MGTHSNPSRITIGGHIAAAFVGVLVAAPATTVAADIAVSVNQCGDPIAFGMTKLPRTIPLKANGAWLSSAPTLRIRGPGINWSLPWPITRPTTWSPNLPSNLPNNADIRVELADGTRITSINLRTAFPYSPPAGLLATAYTTPFQGVYAGECTNLAYRLFFDFMRISSTKWSGHARTWITNAAAAGWAVDTRTTEGRVGSIVVWDGPAVIIPPSTTPTRYGHVGVVTDVTKTSNTDFLYTITEQNWPTGSRANSITLSSRNLARASGYPFLGFVLPYASALRATG
jgi:surface antigen